MKILKQILTYLILGGGFTLFIPQKGRAQQSQPLPDFDRINASGAAHLELNQADRYSFFSDASADDLKGLEAYVENRTLFIKSKKIGDIKLKIYFKELEALEVSEAVSVKTPDTLKVKQLYIQTSGASKASILINAEQVKISAKGAADIRVAGNAGIVSIEASGAASVKASQLIAKEVTAEASGASDVKTYSSEKLNATTTGTGNIRFAGDPKLKNFAINGLGSVKNMDGDDEYSADIFSGTGPDGDTTRVKIGKRRFIIIDEDKKRQGKKNDDDSDDPFKRRRMKRVWSGFELGVNGFVTPDFNFNMKPANSYLNTQYGRSWFIGLNLPEIDGHIIRNKLAVTTGFGLKWTWMEFDGKNIMRPDTNMLTSIPSLTNLKENELNTFNLTLPVLLKFAPGNAKKANRGFHIAAGAIVNYVASSHLKTVTTDGGFETTTTYDTDFNINPFRIDATVRVGYDRLKFFANYSLTPYFDSSKAPDIRTFSAGMTLIGF